MSDDRSGKDQGSWVKWVKRGMAVAAPAAGAYLTQQLKEIAHSRIAREAATPLEELLQRYNVEHAYRTRDGKAYVVIGGKVIAPQSSPSESTPYNRPAPEEGVLMIRGIKPQEFEAAAKKAKVNGFVRKLLAKATTNLAFLVEVEVEGKAPQNYKGQAPLDKTSIKNITVIGVENRRPYATAHLAPGSAKLPQWCNYTVDSIDGYLYSDAPLTIWSKPKKE